MGKAARKLSGAALAEFNAKHPRGAGGKFVKSGTAAPSVPAAPAAPTAGRARARLGVASKVDMPTALGTLRAKREAPVSGDREAVDAILKPMSHAQLDEVAREFGMASFVRGTKEEKSRQLREGIVGAKLDHNAIMSVDLGSPFAPPTRADADAAFARIADINQRGAAAEASGAKPRRRARAALAATAESNPLTQLHQADLKQRLTALASERDGEQQAEAMLSGLSLAALKDLSVQIGPTAKLPSKVTKAQAVHRIIEGTIGFRQRSEGIARGSNPWADRLASGAATSGGDQPRVSPQQRAADESDAPAVADRLRRRAMRTSGATDRLTSGPTARTEPERIRARAMEALERAGARNGDTMGIEQLRAAMGGTRAEQDAILNQLNDERLINLMPQSNQKIMTGERRAAALRRGNEDKTLVMLGSAAAQQSGPTSGGAAQRLQAAQQTPDLDAKRQRLAQLEAEAEEAMSTTASRQLRRMADDLRREIGREERGEDAGKVDQPREVTKAQIVDKVAELLAQSGDSYLSLVRLRGHLSHIKHDEVTAALKELDRARIIQLDPDSNQKAVPLEALDSAVTLGGERKLLVSLVGGTGRAAQRLRGNPKA